MIAKSTKWMWKSAEKQPSRTHRGDQQLAATKAAAERANQAKDHFLAVLSPESAHAGPRDGSDWARNRA
jgi:hypothetical protein